MKVFSLHKIYDQIYSKRVENLKDYDQSSETLVELLLF